MKTEQFQVHVDHEDSHWWFQARRQIMLDLVHRILPPSKDRLVVDIGCGTGANIAALASDYQCIGTDVADDAIRAARERFPNVEFLKGFAPEVLGELAEQADLFLLMDVLEHVEDDFGLLAKLIGASRKGANFLLTVPAGPQLWSEHDSSFGHYRRYTLETFTELWRKLPVKVRLVSYYNSYLYPIARASRLVTRRMPGRSLGEAGTDVRMVPGLNGVLYRTFLSERRVLAKALEKGKPVPFHQGVSLVAILTTQAEPVRLRELVSAPRPEFVEAELSEKNGHDSPRPVPQSAGARSERPS